MAVRAQYMNGGQKIPFMNTRAKLLIDNEMLLSFRAAAGGH